MDYFDRYDLINLRRYEEAETNLTSVASAHSAGSAPYQVAAGEAMVAAMNAATPAYHLVDHILNKHAAAERDPNVAERDRNSWSLGCDAKPKS